MDGLCEVCVLRQSGVADVCCGRVLCLKYAVVNCADGVWIARGSVVVSVWVPRVINV